MQTTITARHCEISEPLRERALAVVERLGNIATRPMEASVVFDTDGQGPLPQGVGDLTVAGGDRRLHDPASSGGLRPARR